MAALLMGMLTGLNLVMSRALLQFRVVPTPPRLGRMLGEQELAAAAGATSALAPIASARATSDASSRR